MRVYGVGRHRENAQPAAGAATANTRTPTSAEPKYSGTSNINSSAKSAHSTNSRLPLKAAIPAGAGVKGSERTDVCSPRRTSTRQNSSEARDE